MSSISDIDKKIEVAKKLLKEICNEKEQMKGQSWVDFIDYLSMGTFKAGTTGDWTSIDMWVNATLFDFDLITGFLFTEEIGALKIFSKGENLFIKSGVVSEKVAGTTIEHWIGKTEELAKSSPIKIPDNATIKIQAKSGYDQISYKWSDGGYNYEVRWHTPTPGAPVGEGNSWVVSRITPGTPTGKARIEHIYTGIGDGWTPRWEWQAAIDAYNNGNMTLAQEELLKAGHWSAP